MYQFRGKTYIVRLVSAVRPSPVTELSWNVHIIYPLSHRDELSLHRRKENEFFLINTLDIMVVKDTTQIKTCFFYVVV